MILIDDDDVDDGHDAVDDDRLECWGGGGMSQFQ